MKRSTLCVTALLSVVGAASLTARELRTPLSGMQGRFSARYPAEYHQVKNKKSDKKDACWGDSFDLQVFTQGYHRSADKAYGHSHSHCAKEAWSSLIFGESDMRLENIFPNSNVDHLLKDNPFVSISTLKPRFEYNENGVLFGMQGETNFKICGSDYRLGARVRIPYRDIEVSDPCGTGDLVGEQLEDVYKKRLEITDNNDLDRTNTVFAARMDFLDALNRVALPQEGMIKYNGTTQPTIQIADQDVGQSVTAQNQPIVGVIRSTDGSMPDDQRWGKQAISANFDGEVAGDGSGGADNDRLRFNRSTDYTNLDTNHDAQKQLFVVPNLNDGGTINELTSGAEIIRNQIDLAVNALDSSVKDFIREQGLSFCDGRTKGIGDLDMEFYLGRNWNLCDWDFYSDMSFGVRVPTGDALTDCKAVLKQPLGNNDHPELRIAYDLGWDVARWFKLSVDGAYSWALKHKESVAAPFKGATVKNVGPCVNADVKWGYFLGHFDATVIANDRCGFDLGYEIYHKSTDKISLSTTTATPFGLTSESELDSAVLSKDTKRTAHKLRAGMFTMIGDCEISGGWSHVFAGKNVPRETDYYISMIINF